MNGISISTREGALGVPGGNATTSCTPGIGAGPPRPRADHAKVVLVEVERGAELGRLVEDDPALGRGQPGRRAGHLFGVEDAVVDRRLEAVARWGAHVEVEHELAAPVRGCAGRPARAPPSAPAARACARRVRRRRPWRACPAGTSRFPGRSAGSSAPARRSPARGRARRNGRPAGSAATSCARAV